MSLLRLRRSDPEALVNFTRLGQGDLTPDGHLRFMTAMEDFHDFLLNTAAGTFVLQLMGGNKTIGKLAKYYLDNASLRSASPNHVMTATLTFGG